MFHIAGTVVGKKTPGQSSNSKNSSVPQNQIMQMLIKMSYRFHRVDSYEKVLFLKVKGKVVPVLN
jgi:hypothetical protein